MNRIHLLAPGTILLAATSFAAPDITGMMSTTAAGILADDGTGIPAVQIRPAGSSSAPIGWNPSPSPTGFGAATANHPDYSMAALTAGLASGGWPVGPNFDEFNSISSGKDVIPGVSSSGVLQIPSGLWFALDVGVDAGTIGEPNSLIRRVRTALGGSAEGTIFSYTAEGSGGLAAMYAGTVRAEQLPSQVGFSSQREIQGLDWWMGVNATTNGQGSNLFPELLPGEPARFFFTVTSDWMLGNLGGGSPLTVPRPLPSGASVNEPIDSGSIYVMRWEDTGSTYAWSAPEVAFSRNELNLLHVLEPIDGISISWGRGGKDMVIFSPDPWHATTRDEILVFSRSSWDHSVLCSTTALKEGPASNPVNYSTKIGLRPPSGNSPDRDKAKHVCSRDPEAFLSNHATAVPMFFVGNILGQSLRDPNLGIAASRDPGTNNEVYIEVSGIDLSDYSGGGLLVFEYGFQTLHPNGATPMGAMNILSWQVVTTTDEIVAHATPLPVTFLDQNLFLRASVWVEREGGEPMLLQGSVQTVVHDTP